MDNHRSSILSTLSLPYTQYRATLYSAIDNSAIVLYGNQVTKSSRSKLDRREATTSQYH